MILRNTHHICVSNKRISSSLMGDSRARRRTEGRSDSPCQTSAPIATQTGGKSQVRLRAEPISAGGALEVQPPDLHRLKCKPVSGAVRKQIENFVLLVPDRKKLFLDALSDSGHAGRGAGSTQEAQTGHPFLHLRLQHHG